MLFLVLAAETASPTQGPLLTAFVQYLLPIIMTGLSGLLGWAMTLGVNWVKAKADGAKAGTAQQKALHAVSVASEGAAAVVAHLNATVVDRMKAAAADGVITAEEAAKVKADALAELKKLPAPILGALSGFFGGSLDTYLSGLIEQHVTKQKAPAASPAPAVP